MDSSKQNSSETVNKFEHEILNVLKKVYPLTEKTKTKEQSKFDETATNEQKETEKRLNGRITHYEKKYSS